MTVSKQTFFDRRLLLFICLTLILSLFSSMTFVKADSSVEQAAPETNTVLGDEDEKENDEEEDDGEKADDEEKQNLADSKGDEDTTSSDEIGDETSAQQEESHDSGDDPVGSSGESDEIKLTSLSIETQSENGSENPLDGGKGGPDTGEGNPNDDGKGGPAPDDDDPEHVNGKGGPDPNEGDLIDGGKGGPADDYDPVENGKGGPADETTTEDDESDHPITINGKGGPAITNGDGTLPKTATNTYHILTAGTILLIFGTALLYYRRKIA